MSVNSLNSTLVHMMESGEFSDLKFVCQGEEFQVHKAIVCGKSPVIKAAIQRGFKESHTNVIVLDSFQCSTVKRLVQFIYTGDYDDPETPQADGNACSGNTDKADEGVLPNDQLQHSASDEGSPIPFSKGEFKPSLPPPSTPSASLLEHIRVNSTGDYYRIDELVTLANAKITHLLRSNKKDQSWVPSLPLAIEAAVRSTGDGELLDILASATAANISTVTELDQFESIRVMTGFSMKKDDRASTGERTAEQMRDLQTVPGLEGLEKDKMLPEFKL
ncbi:hypothetical protein H634G_10876 [Metarhizium anisopliae BRIP 53293]|uniref:BTB domain-containing protein n=1 Tax=Metarhizium anisopliae BRIP 53293 TaxID=1291518 RepID=A0A0D9NMK8_METAN|nr:hypothetical protein H634G_10876 [Metarhizium anisopliae BRIP 53293]KJK88378.1 hypothetical protein H633G_07768 [Metarhizium anisopliae BRIP 53284]